MVRVLSSKFYPSLTRSERATDSTSKYLTPLYSTARDIRTILAMQHKNMFTKCPRFIQENAFPLRNEAERTMTAPGFRFRFKVHLYEEELKRQAPPSGGS